jgi:Type I restriction modification DNA specificity domain
VQRLDQIFRLRYGHSLELNSLRRVHAPAGVNFVSRAMGNNGVTARVDVDEAPADAGEVSVALSGNGVLSAFVQPEPFVCGHHVMVLTAIDPAMSVVEKLWWARCIWENRYRFSYGRQANRTLGSLLVPDSPPDWALETQIPSHEGLAKSLSKQVVFRDPESPLWSDFPLGDLFEIEKGKRLTKADRLPGATRFVGASEKNNGITGTADVAPRFVGGALTVPYNGSVGYAFFQDKPFFASDDVHVLVPKEPLSKWAQLFVAAVIRHGRNRFTYGYKWTLARMHSSTVRLPATPEGLPDWDYMESLVKGLPFSAAVAHAGSRLMVAEN